MNGSAGQSLGSASATRPTLEASRIGDRFDMALNQMADMSQRLNALANRISGNVPEPVSNGGTDRDMSPTPSSFIRATDHRFDALSAEMDRAFSALSRLEQFA